MMKTTTKEQNDNRSFFSPCQTYYNEYSTSTHGRPKLIKLKDHNDESTKNKSNRNRMLMMQVSQTREKAQASGRVILLQRRTFIRRKNMYHNKDNLSYGLVPDVLQMLKEDKRSP